MLIQLSDNGFTARNKDMVVILSHKQNIIISKIDCSDLWVIEYYRILHPQSYFQMSNSCCVTWLDDD